ncbi:MAG: hypothetical protein JNK75_06655 [Betaproteobacteria bacterium]|nr:hypothetical protein [Betaproteobacteria bacterium]
MISRTVSIAALLLGLVVVGGCQTTGGVSESPSNAPVRKEEAVKVRAQARWDALLGKDFNKAFGYISPTGRATLPMEVFTGRLAGSVWNAAKVESVSCEAEICDVKIAITYPLLPGRPHTGVFEEKWILEQGQWWLVYRG